MDETAEPGQYKDGQRKGLDANDYRRAVQKYGSMRAAAKKLDVSRPTVREMCVRHDIYVRSIDGVPKPVGDS